MLEQRQLLSSTAAFLGIDTATQGSWKGAYGCDGYGIVNNATKYPAYAHVTTSNAIQFTWNPSTGDVRALQNAAKKSTDRIASCWYNTSDFYLNVNLTDGKTHQVSLYALDWDSNARSERVDVVDASTKAVLDTETVSGFYGGKYLRWNVTGNVQFHITDLAGANAVISGLFFSPPLVASISAPASVNEGSTATLTGSATGGSGQLSYAWDLSHSGSYTTPGQNVSDTFLSVGTSTVGLQVTDSVGVKATSTASIIVHSVAPTVNIGGPYQGTAQTAVTFAASATEPDPVEQTHLAYAWNFGDGTTATGSSPSHAFAQDGIYNVTLTVTNPSGLSTQATTVVDVFPSVSAGLDPTVNEGQAVNFVGTATGSGSLTYHWSFGDGGTADGTLTPSYVYTEQGTYTATLTATDTVYGFSTSSSIPMTVLDVAPTVALNAPSQGTAGTPVSFTATASSPSPIDQAAGFSYSWNFGDGSTGTGATPTHTYAGAGTFTVSLTATDVDGAASAPATATLTIQSSLPSFSFDFGTATSPLAAGYTKVTASTAYSSSQGFGWLSGSIQDRDRGTPSAPLRDFNFTTDGTFAVDLTDGTYSVTISSGDATNAHDQEGIYFQGQQVDSITTAAGQFATKTYQVVVSTGQLDMRLKDLGGSDPNSVINAIQIGSANSTLVVNAGPNSTSNEGQAVNFAGTVTGGTSPYTYHWDFGDGGTADGTLTPAHTYADNGSYTVTLTVTDAGGTSLQSSLVATVNNVPPTASLSSPSQGIVGTPVRITASATDPSPVDQAAGFTYAWNFGDGTTGSGASASHTYTATGTYTVLVTATDKDGGVSTPATSTLTVSAASSLTVSAGGAVSTNEGTSITFAGTAAGGTAPYTEYWNFGDGTTTTGTTTPSHTYQDNGTYTALLYVTDSAGNTAASTATITVANVAPTVTLSGPSVGNANSEVNFMAVASDPGTVDTFAGFTYAWNFGDGATIQGTAQSPFHTYTSAGTYTVSVTATDKDGATSMTATTAIVISLATVIPIDQTWLSQRGAGPYVLDQANTTYVLQTDVATSGTAFVIAARNVTFDLNGHTVTYNNAQPLTVPNGDFETDPIGSTTISNWDCSGASSSSFQVIANDGTLFGSKCVQWTISDGAGPQVIQSSAIAIPEANRTYTASVTGASPTGRNLALKVEVVDSVTGLVEANFVRTDGNESQGDAAKFSFYPTTTNSVYIRVTATLGSGSGNTTFRIDRAVISRSMDYGVLAAHCDSYGLTGYSGASAQGGTIPRGYLNLPSSVGAVYQNVYAPTIKDSVGTGQITQGNAGGAYCYAIEANGTMGSVLIDGVTTYTWGDDITPIETYVSPGTSVTASDTRTIHNCTLNWPSSGLNITVRSDCQPSIDIYGPSSATVAGCTLNGFPMVGVKAGGASTGFQHLIQSNNFYPNGVITNCYAIYVAASNVKVLNNKIDCGTTGSSRGIGVCSLSTGPLSNVEIGNNYINTREKPNREYGSNIQARAIRVRSLGGGPLVNINIHDNTAIAHTGAGLMTEAIACRIDAIPDGTTNFVLTNNLFKAVIDGPTDPGPQYKAKALCVDQCAMVSDSILFQNNTFESDDTAVQLAYADAGGSDYVRNLVFRNNIIKLSSDGVPRSFQSFSIGYWTLAVTNVQFIGTSFANGATSAITWGGTAQKNVSFGWELGTNVADGSGNPLAGATVQVTDSTGMVFAEGVTDATGNLVLDIATTTYSGSSTVTATSCGPLTMVVTDAGHRTVTRPVTLTSNQSVSITLNNN